MKPMIMVVGLLPGQVALVERDCRKVGARLKFVEGRRNGNLPGSADHCVLMLKFISHCHSNKAMAQFPRNRVHFHKGGLAELVQTITGITDGSVTRGARHPMHTPQ